MRRYARVGDKKDKAIRISGRTRGTLRAISMKNETYDDVIKRLIYEFSEKDDELGVLLADVKKCLARERP